jgi:predicted Fe-Mo cluster-binding NifX family protein
MKIAVVTDDQTTISAHFGRAQYYLVFIVENGKIVGQETRSKPGHNQFPSEPHDENHARAHGTGPHSEARHAGMMDVISDCDVLLACGMGQGAHDGLELRGILPIITDIHGARSAVEAYLAGSIVDHRELLH